LEQWQENQLLLKLCSAHQKHLQLDLQSRKIDPEHLSTGLRIHLALRIGQRQLLNDVAVITTASTM
jgi:hypothetical protein